ncbi:MAG: glycoside hydrolase family 5 protein [Silicimonas sp.]|nr:glycoside hydrolase family 5 protein [Silicimonas sp.]
MVGRLCLALWIATALPVASFPVERCVNLSNFLEVQPDQGWAYNFEPSHLQTIADAGFDTLRLPLRVGSYWQGDRIDPRFLYLMTSVVEDAQMAGLQVIVDLHHYEAFISDPVSKGDEFVAIWEALSAHFAGWSGLIFEIVNEPTNAVQTSQLVPYYRRALAAIRVHHPEAWVIFGGAYWNHLNELDALPRPDDPRVVHTFHYYLPFEFTHQQAPWFEKPLPPASWGSTRDIEAVQADMERAAKHHTTLFLGEFGVYRAAPPADRAAWLNTVREAAETNDIAWCHWGFGAGFGLFDPEVSVWNTAILDSLIPR